MMPIVFVGNFFDCLLVFFQERMMYSTCKGPLLDVLEREMEIEFAKKVCHLYTSLCIYYP